MLREIVRDQCGVLTRAQALSGGITDEAIEANLAAGRWSRLYLGVYATFSGPPPRPAQLWAAVLRAGAGAMLSHESAAEIWGLVDRPAPKIHVTVPHRRTVRRMPGVVVHRSTWASDRCHPGRTLPRTRIEDTVIDLTQTARDVGDVISWLTRAVGSRLTTVDRLRTAVRCRPRLRWRAVICSALDDVEAGCHSYLEVAYLRDVERAHGLPPGRRQAARLRTTRGGDGESRGYDDVLYDEYATRVELDGRAAHPAHARWRDGRNDNSVVLSGGRPLRYGLDDVLVYPCDVAGEVVATLRLGGWRDPPHPCTRPNCTVT